MDYSTEILTLWVGPQSQQVAHHFYSLQAEQFFDEEEDPTDHRAMWNLSGNHEIQKTPKMMVFDTKSDHLIRIRKVNHAKMIKKIAQVSKTEYSFNFFAQPQKEQEQIPADQHAYLFQNQNAKQDNYVLIDKKFSEDSRSFEHWESLYNLEQDLYEDKIRKRLQQLDYLHILNFCSDGTRLGFSYKLLSHFLDQCPKRQIIFTNLSESKNQEYVQEVCLPLLSQISQDVTMLIDVDVSLPQFDYFQANFYHHFSPVYNCILTPFMLKKGNSTDYFLQVCQGKRSLFDIAYTMPIISQHNQLASSTNIFKYAFDTKNPLNKEHQQVNRVNYGNKSFLNVPKYHGQVQQPMKKDIKYQKVFFSSQKILSQAFVLKGHFNEITKLYQQRSPLFDIKYLQGIFIANPQYNLNYSEFYKKPYGQKVQSFPMQTVLYQNSAFGPAIRNYLKHYHSNSLKNQLINSWKQGAFSLADLYGEELDQESD